MAALNEPHPSAQIIDGEGILNLSALEGFVQEVSLTDCGDASWGHRAAARKSTFLNHSFGTDFREMDCLQGRSQTTRGIWIAKAAGIDPCTLVIDLEGSDGRERGEEDTVFEKKIALFALAISDILLINMWCHDIGREHAASKPLLRTVFQVMMQLFGPKKKTLMFVIRDKEPTPLDKLESTIREDVQKIWESVPKPEAHKQTPLGNFFNVQIVALSSFRFEREQFDTQVDSLRRRFFHSTAPGGLADRDTRDVIGASGFSFSVRQVWEVIKENKDLDLPAHQVMVATFRCEQISEEMFCSFAKNEDWLHLEEAAKEGPMPDFGSKVCSMIRDCLSRYEAEAKYFNEGVRVSKQKQLMEKLLQLVQPAFLSVLGHMRSTTLDEFKKAFNHALTQGSGFQSSVHICTQHYMAVFDEACTGAVIEEAMWDDDMSRVRENLVCDMDAYIDSVRSDMISELTRVCEVKLRDDLAGPVETLFDEANDETWSSIRKLLWHETELAARNISIALSDLGADEQIKENMPIKLRDNAEDLVEKRARERAERVSILMKDRFSRLFFPHSNSIRGIWTGKEDIPAFTVASRSASLKLLSVMAAVRLDDKADCIEGTLSVAFSDNLNPSPVGASGCGDSTHFDSLAVSSTWEEVPTSKTLLTPAQCVSLWRQFIQETDCIVDEAISTKVMIGKARCEEISKENFSIFAGSEDWRCLEEAARGGLVPGFGRKLTSLIQACLARYETEAEQFDRGTRVLKQTQLKQDLLQLVQPAFQSILGHISSKTIGEFKEDIDRVLQRGKKHFESAAGSCIQHHMDLFDEACIGVVIEQARWDTSRVREDLRRDMDSHVAFLRADTLSQFIRSQEEKLNEALSGPVAALLDEANDETWSSIRNLLLRETERAMSDTSVALSSFEMEEQVLKEKLAELGDHAKKVVETKVREGAGRVSILMKDRFSRLFFHDSHMMPRSLKGKENIEAIALAARSASLKQLSVMAAVRLDDEADDVEEILYTALLDDHGTTGSTNSASSLSSNTWEKIPTLRTVLSPIKCASLWKQFIQETECIVTQAISAQELKEGNKNWIPQTIYAASSVLGAIFQGIQMSRN